MSCELTVRAHQLETTTADRVGMDSSNETIAQILQYTSVVCPTASTPHEITRLQPASTPMSSVSLNGAWNSQLECNIRLNARLKVRRILLRPRPPILIHEVLCKLLYNLSAQFCELDHARLGFSKVALEGVFEEGAPVRCAAG